MSSLLRSSASSLRLRVLLLWLVAGCIVGAMAQQTYYEETKKNDPNNRPFYMGSRYGRSDSTILMPRAERYGKRTSRGFFLGRSPGDLPVALSAEGGPLSREEMGTPDAETMDTQPRPIRCAYLGIGNLYRCLREDAGANSSR